MAKHVGSAFAVIEHLATDTETPIGRRLESLRHIRRATEDAERRLLMQLGVDFAKHLAAEGFAPSGLPVGEALAAAAKAIGNHEGSGRGAGE